MKRYLLDAGIAQDYINKRHGSVTEPKRKSHAATGLASVFPSWASYGLASRAVPPERGTSNSFEGAFPDSWSGRIRTKRLGEFGRFFAELRRIGRPMQQIEIQIAAIAMTLGNCAVVSSEADLAAVPGLDVEDWAAG